MTLSDQSPSTTPGSTTAPSTDTLGTPMRKRSGTIGLGVAIAIAIVLLLVGIGGGYFLGVYETKSSTPVTQVTETGSSLLYPLMQIWGPNYTKFDSSVSVSSVSSGSGAGQTAALKGTFDIGGSDAYLANASHEGVLNVPVAISAQLIYYNLPGMTGHLNLNGTLLAMIYGGAITSWNDTLIRNAQSPAIDSNLGNLSSAEQKITVIYRGDSSGDTFLFTTLCNMSWKGFPFANSTSGFSGIATKLSNTQSETGNSQMVTGVEAIEGGIAYIGISYMSKVSGANVNYAALGDNTTLPNGNYTAASGHYILPTATTISNDANLGLTHLNYNYYGLAVSLIQGGFRGSAINNTPGGGGTDPLAGETGTNGAYPIVNLEYALIRDSPTGSVGSGALVDTVQFLQWAASLGNNAIYLHQVGFVPLTTLVLGYDQEELASVTA
jgi:phosphate transport system substrate-binding protein